MHPHNPGVESPGQELASIEESEQGDPLPHHGVQLGDTLHVLGCLALIHGVVVSGVSV